MDVHDSSGKGRNPSRLCAANLGGAGKAERWLLVIPIFPKYEKSHYGFLSYFLVGPSSCVQK